MQYGPRLTGVTALAGGLLWALVPLLDDTYPGYETILPLVPLVLLVGVHGLARRPDVTGPLLGRTERLSLGVGFAFLFAAALVYAYGLATQAGIVVLFLVGIPAILGLVLVAGGSAGAAYTLWKREELPTWVALLFGLSLPLDPLFNGLVTPVFSAGLSLYGVAWVVLGSYLLRDAVSKSDSTEPSGQNVQ